VFLFFISRRTPMKAIRRLLFAPASSLWMQIYIQVMGIAVITNDYIGGSGRIHAIPAFRAFVPHVGNLFSQSVMIFHKPDLFHGSTSG
jgi:hypothetical protein